MDIITEIFLMFNSVFPVYRSPNHTFPFAKECVIDGSYKLITLWKITPDIKNILINEILPSLNLKLKNELYVLRGQNTKLKNYKQYFSNILNRIRSIITRKDEMVRSFNTFNADIQDQIYSLGHHNSKRIFLPFKLERIDDYVLISNSRIIWEIAHIAGIEDIIFVIRKIFENRKISFADAIRDIRHCSRTIFKIKFCKHSN
jgi:hypothetical protein